NGHAGVFQQGAVDVVEPGDLDILAVAQPVPVQLRCCRDFPAVTGGVMEVLGIMGGIAEQLFGDAADVDTGTAEPAFLSQRDPGSQGCRDAGSPHATGASSNDKKIIIKISQLAPTL